MFIMCMKCTLLRVETIVRETMCLRLSLFKYVRMKFKDLIKLIRIL